MPYTPPTARSPATSKPNSPILSRNHSYSEQSPAPSLLPQRPAIPRSLSSTSYLNKHRRSPTITTHHGGSNGHVVTPSRHGRGSSASGSLRSSPTPVNNLLIPPGAVTTPPDSSDDDEERGRDIGDIKELQEALKNFELNRAHSPSSDEHAEIQSPSSAPPVRPGGLTPEARKISHSRSASEITLSQHASQLDTGRVISSTESSDAEDDELRMKPPLLRKKSGELVKPALRPSTARRRPSSMPGTPTYSKAVHFNENMEQVRTFFHLERPMAVSAGSSPVETYDDDGEYPFGYDDGYRSKVVEWDIKLSNFPTDTYERKTAPVRIERIFLAADHKTLVGTVAVANIAFHKLVVARFTLDYWKTTSEVVAEYNHDVRKKQSNDGHDRFNFNIKLADQANLESKTLLLCVRYNVNGQEFWDNNNSMNYQVDFVKKVKPKPKSKNSSRPLGAIPRSRQSPPAPRPRSMPAGSFDDDFSHSLDVRFQFDSGPFLGDPLNQPIALKPRSKRGSLFPDQKATINSSGNALSARYDFESSLKTALNNAQTATGRPIPRKTPQENASKPVAPKPSTVAVAVSGTGAVGLPSEKPDLKSDAYNELIQKFCFFAPTVKGSPTTSSPAAKSSPADTTTDRVGNHSSSESNQTSASNSPPSPARSPLVDGANDEWPIVNGTYLLPRSNSPGPVSGSGPEDRLDSFLFGYNMHGNIFPERAHTPQACV